MKSKKCIISLKNVTYSYTESEPPIIKNVNLEVYRGEFLGIIGPTGSGKTTLLNVISGAVPHYFKRGVLEGEVLINGVQTEELSLAKVTEQIGLVMQDPEAQLFNLLVRDEIIWGMENRGYSRDAMKRRLAEIVDAMSLQGFLDRVTYDLSGGEKQRVAISAIYGLSPKLIVLDNPTSQLDPVGSTMVIKTITDLIKQGDHGVIMVEDKVGELLRHANRLVLINNGEVVLETDPRTFCSKKDILDSAGVGNYELAELAYELIMEGMEIEKIPINLEEGVEIFSSLLAKRRDKKSVED